MEGLFILIAVFVIDALIKNAAKKRKQQQQLPRQNQSRQDSSRHKNFENEETSQNQAPRNLRELIQQFENAQREAAQGNIEPPTPPVDNYSDDDELPVVKPANPGHFSFKEIAESVIQWEEASVGYLQEAFGFTKATAEKVLAELQKHKIVGRDMGDGFCDVLVHDKVELGNLFKREQAEAKKQLQDDLARKKAELKSKHANDELEARAREAREHAGTDLAEAAVLASAADGSDSTKRRAALLSTKNIADIRRGFLWAKVIDEPRFKHRWSARAR